MDFGAFPPEFNSARMYAGAGSAPMMAAATAWNGLAVELTTTAAAFDSVITELTTEQWLGPASLSMAAAAQPFVAWLTQTAESTALAGAQAMASAAAFEAAFAMTVPPAEVAANRAQLAALIATNVLGQNTPAIAATEALYGEMWAQDALAMYGYAAASATAGKLNPLTAPAEATNPAGIAGQASAVSRAAAGSGSQVGLNNLIGTVPDAVMGLAAPAAAANPIGDAISDFLSIPFVDNAINGVLNTAAWLTTAGVTTAVFLQHTLDTVPGAAAAVGLAPFAAAGLAGSVTPAGMGGLGLGTASSVGGLSVPVSWATAAPAVTVGATAAQPSSWTVPAEAAPIAGIPGAPGLAMGGRGAGGYAGPRYGVKPVVMPPVVV
ncbi:PPE family protein [Mycobacterium vicinigordonae]|uniref:PPE family protein n=1 Tax=Mycobacterium vicinigordonae TaxID=1719132 RepID=A0A7D6I9R6_9MYCO|nr:PPE family protein [Mycobacterium vicinigordonae]QLL09316.1 PPE family protein [Mycobacterium vicinigordonae]